MDRLSKELREGRRLVREGNRLRDELYVKEGEYDRVRHACDLLTLLFECCENYGTSNRINDALEYLLECLKEQEDHVRTETVSLREEMQDHDQRVRDNDLAVMVAERREKKADGFAL